MPWASKARTSKTCLPVFRCLYDFGDLQPLKRVRSSLHLKLDPVSVDANRNLALRFVVLAFGRGLCSALESRKERQVEH